jgi:hypothetical protein
MKRHSREVTTVDVVPRSRRDRSSESGIALVFAMFMVLIASSLASSLMFISQTETLSTMNYTTMSQVRYGAESGVHSAANYLMFTYVSPGDGADPLANYDTSVSPVTWNGDPVVLASDANASHYPTEAKRTGFAQATPTNATLKLNNRAIVYNARATLMSMRQITEAITGLPVTLQTWEITGVARASGAGSAEVEVSATIERQEVSLFRYAAFATYTGCEALKFGGGATTDSYDSRELVPVSGGPAGTNQPPVPDLWGSSVGTNGNLTELGSTTAIHGSLSTPRTGVGNCTDNNITGLTQTGGATVDDGMIQLPQTVTYPSPGAPNPLPPTTNMQFQTNSGCPTGVDYCTAQAGIGATITPPSASTVVTLGDVSVTGGAALHLSAGTYVVNSLSFAGNSSIVLDGTGPVIFKVAGLANSGNPLTTAVDFTGGSITNASYNPSAFQILYDGPSNVKLAGGSSSAALVYAPSASVSFVGSSDFYGAVVSNKVTDMGGVQLHYDRSLQTDMLVAGNFTMGSFTWKSY